MPSYYDSSCDSYSLQQALEIPLSPEPLLYILNPNDLQFEKQDAGANLSIKYQRFTRDLAATFDVFNITLYSVEASEYNQIINFATSDFLTNVLTTGRGSITLYLGGVAKNNCYIQTPIQASESVFKNWERPTPTEVFNEVKLTIVSPDVSWY